MSLSISGATASLQNRNQKKAGNGKQPSASKLPAIPSTQGAINREQKTAVGGKATKKSSLPTVKAKLIAAPKSLSILQIAQERLAAPAEKNDSCGEVMVRFNHYRKKFPIYNGVLKWEDVDNEYAISFAYAGSYRRELLCLPAEAINENYYKEIALLRAQQHQSNTPNTANPIICAIHDDEYKYFINMKTNEVYMLQVQEDESHSSAAENSQNRAALQASQLSSLSRGANLVPSNSKEKCSMAPNNQFKLITEELKGLAVKNQLDTATAKDLLERRDLEDVLFSNH